MDFLLAKSDAGGNYLGIRTLGGADNNPDIWAGLHLFCMPKFIWGCPSEGISRGAFR